MSENRDGRETEYGHQLEILEKALGTVYAIVVDINLTRDFYRILCGNSVEDFSVGNEGRLDELFLYMIERSCGDGTNAEVIALFNRENLLVEYAAGGRDLRLGHEMWMGEPEGHWMETRVILEESTDGEVHGILLIRNMRKEMEHAWQSRMEEMKRKHKSDRDHELSMGVATCLAKTFDEVYLIDTDTDTYGHVELLQGDFARLLSEKNFPCKDVGKAMKRYRDKYVLKEDRYLLEPYCSLQGMLDSVPGGEIHVVPFRKQAEGRIIRCRMSLMVFTTSQKGSYIVLGFQDMDSSDNMADTYAGGAG